MSYTHDGPYLLQDKALVDRLIEAISKGCTYAVACHYAGVSYVTYRKWMRRGLENFESHQENGTKLDIYGKLHVRVTKAEGDAVCRWLDAVEKAANGGQWQAAAWKLERRYPHDYGKERDEVDKKLEENQAELKEIREMISKCMKTT